MFTALLTSVLFFALQSPFDDSPAAVEAGLRVYRSNCARCHDLNAQGYRGRDLTQLSTRQKTNAQLATIITRGIGTEMPAIRLDPMDTAHVITYLRSLGGPAVVDKGDANRGESLFWGKYRCGGCHMIGGRGGRLGPDLTQEGAARSKSFLIREIRNPSEYIPRGFEPVMIVTSDGHEIAGVRKNEDAFSIQIMDVNENLQSFFKDELRDVRPLETSLMPTYGPNEIDNADLDDLLRYLASLR